MPWGFLYHQRDSKENKKPDVKNLDKCLKLTMVGIGIILLPSLYCIPASFFETANFTKWNSETLKQNKLEKQIQQQNTYRTQFQTLDKNKDDVIDSTEFIYGK